MTSQDPRRPPRTFIDSGLFGWVTGAIVISAIIVAIITLFDALNPSHTQSAPSSTGQAGTPSQH